MGKKLKIRGITGMPLFFTRLHGRMDGKRKVVIFDSGWQGHYLEKKEAILQAFLHSAYRDLEEHTAPLHKESAVLTVEYEDVRDQLAEPEEPPTGANSSSMARDRNRKAAGRDRLQARKVEIQTRLAAIEEALIQAVGEAAVTQRQAVALTQRRIQAYLHGASLAAKTVRDTKYPIQSDFDREADYLERHKENDEARRSILAEICGGDKNAAAAVN